MTNIQLLALFNDYLSINKNIVVYMMWSMEDLKRGREDYSWKWLLLWCEVKDDREEIWKRLKPHYPEALMLKEGIFND